MGAALMFIVICGRGGASTLFLHAKFPCDCIPLLFTMSHSGVGELPPVVQPELVRTGKLVEVCQTGFSGPLISRSFTSEIGTSQSHAGSSRSSPHKWHRRSFPTFQPE